MAEKRTLARDLDLPSAGRMARIPSGSEVEVMHYLTEQGEPVAVRLVDFPDSLVPIDYLRRLDDSAEEPRE